MSIEHEVGSTAGEVYKKFFDGEKYVPLSKIVKTLNKDPRVVVLALGWLLRETKIEVRRDGGKLLIKVLK